MAFSDEKPQIILEKVSGTLKKSLKKAGNIGLGGGERVQREALGMRQTVQGSFSAVSKRNFASQYSFESSRRDLHNALLCTALKSHLLKILRIFSKFAKIFHFFF